jgi:short-subunit dehydrogenase
MNVLIVGATSGIAEATARQYARRGDTLYLLARDTARVGAIASDLRVRGAAAVHTAQFQAEAHAQHEEQVAAVWHLLGHLDIALIAHGVLPDQAACDTDPALAIDSFETNAVSVASILGWLAVRFATQGSGTIAVISSVAGDRGRKSNYVYGAAKAFVTTYVSGLRHRLHGRNVRVTLIKPGFVDTRMTAHLPKGLLWTSAETAGRCIVRGVDRGATTVYVPGFWRYIMWIVRAMPEFVFVRTSL